MDYDLKQSKGVPGPGNCIINLDKHGKCDPWPEK